MEETLRPLTADERRTLERILTSKPQGGGAGFGAFLAFLVTTGVLLILSPASWQIGVLSLVPVVIGVGVAALVFRRLRRSRRRSEWVASRMEWCTARVSDRIARCAGVRAKYMATARTANHSSQAAGESSRNMDMAGLASLSAVRRSR